MIKDLIIKMQNIQDQKSKQEIQLETTKRELDIVIEQFRPRLEEMREKYYDTLQELKKEFDDHFSGYWHCGYRQIEKIELFETHYEIICKSYPPRCEDDKDFELERTKIPYDSEDDALFVEELKEQRKREYLKALKIEKDQKEKEELATYLTLKQKYEKQINEEK